MILTNEEVAILLAGIRSMSVGESGEPVDIFEEVVPMEQLNTAIDKLATDCETEAELTSFLQNLYGKIESNFVPYFTGDEDE